MVQLIAIGNSRGVRIPANLIKLAHLSESDIDFEVVENGLLLKTTKKHPRANWSQALKSAGLIDQNDLDFVSNKFDDEEWEWPHI
jgi:antitoxin component of MazEF toxin-antitoxin module